MCDIVHALLMERAERIALADRQAGLTVALIERWEKYEPVDVDARLAEYDAQLRSEPSPPADGVRARQLLEEVA